MNADKGPGIRAVAILAGLCIVALVGSGCSAKRFAINVVGDALVQGGQTFASDDDPELVRAAVPFSLKLIESLLEESPRHDGLLLAAAKGFTQYAYAFVQQDADVMEDQDFARAEVMHTRARKLYLRARNHGLRGLELRHRGFERALRKDPQAAVQQAGSADVPLLYWTAAAWGAAIAVSKDQPELIADQKTVAALIDRALELDADFDHGTIHTFLITFEMARPGVAGDPAARARRHLERALELSKGNQAGPLVSFAEAVCVPKQNQAEFQALLEQALKIDPNAEPRWRLANLVMQQRARWLLARTADLFFEATVK